MRVGKRLRKRLNRVLARQSLVPNDRVMGISAFPWLKRLEDGAPAIRAELAVLMKHLAAIPPIDKMSPDHRRIAGDGGWRSFFLIGYGIPLDHNIVRMPETMRTLEAVPRLVTAMISIMEPGMHIARHRGVTKAILTAHLGLEVPKRRESCWMDVGGEKVVWEEGRAFVFDDTYKHEVWNNTDENRAILLVQFERPMKRLGRGVARTLYAIVRRTRYIQEAKRNVGYWENRFRQSESAH